MSNVWHICIGGWGASEMEWWDFQKAVLPTERTILIPWHESLTQDPESPVYTTIARLKGPAIVYTWSLGTLFGIRLASMFPEKILGLFVLGGFARFTSADYVPGVDPRQLAAMRMMLRRNRTAILNTFAINTLKPVQDPEWVRSFVQNAESAGTEKLGQGLAALETVDHTDLVRKLTVPVRLVHGAADAVVPASSAVHFCELNPEHCSLVVYPDQGHHLLKTLPAGVISQAEEFHRVLQA